MESGTGQVVQCEKCGAKNRVTDRPSRVAVCGRCKEPLSAVSAKPLIVTDASFYRDVESSELPVLLDMWAAWCGPCRLIAPTIDALAAELSGKVTVGKMDVDANPRTASRYGVQSIPTLLILVNGREANRLVGVQSKEAIMARLREYIQ
ncbi:MAG: thioredoxin [Pyrinomonadaceae bacterium]|nr:thioredoxin [Pyrinomonadaceae bacterium]